MTRPMRELKKLKQMSPMSAEATVVRNYLDWLLGIPWGKRSTQEDGHLTRPRKMLDADHYGLEKVKERIVEYLAVQKQGQEDQGTNPVPRRTAPGVGKTSLGKSIAQGHGS